jgi:hypothetical protein
MPLLRSSRSSLELVDKVSATPHFEPFGPIVGGRLIIYALLAGAAGRAS